MSRATLCHIARGCLFPYKAPTFYSTVVSNPTLFLEIPNPSPRNINTLLSTTHMAQDPLLQKKIIQLAEKIASLPTPKNECRSVQLCTSRYCSLSCNTFLLKESTWAPTQGGGCAGPAKTEDKAEKSTFDVKLEKFDVVAKLKVIKEIRSFTDLGLKEAKDLVEKVPVILKQQVTNSIVKKIKAVGGVAVLE